MADKSQNEKHDQNKTNKSKANDPCRPVFNLEGAFKTFDFKSVHLHIGMPCYGGMVAEATMSGMLNLTQLALLRGMKLSITTMTNESLVTRARNNIMAQMMFNKDATHFMFIDADIRFNPESIFMMLQSDKDVIGGLYPKKTIPTDYVVNVLPSMKIEGDIFTVEAIGTGFLLFKRSVYEKLIQAHPECKYVDDVGLKYFESMMYSIFDVQIGEDGRYLSEDWLFCKRWRAIGGEVWAHSKVLLNHIGTYEYIGNLDVLNKKKDKSLELIQEIIRMKGGQNLVLN